MKQRLTNKQLEVLVYLKDFNRRENDMPLLREIAGQFAVSTSAAHLSLQKLVNRGYLQKSRNGHYRFTTTEGVPQ